MRFLGILLLCTKELFKQLNFLFYLLSIVFNLRFIFLGRNLQFYRQPLVNSLFQDVNASTCEVRPVWSACERRQKMMDKSLSPLHLYREEEEEVKSLRVNVQTVSLWRLVNWKEYRFQYEKLHNLCVLTPVWVQCSWSGARTSLMSRGEMNTGRCPATTIHLQTPSHNGL